MEELTKMELLLLYGMKKAGVPEEDAVPTSIVLKTEEEQARLIQFMMDYPEATPDDIMNEVADILDSKHPRYTRQQVEDIIRRLKES